MVEREDWSGQGVEVRWGWEKYLNKSHLAFDTVSEFFIFLLDKLLKFK